MKIKNLVLAGVAAVALSGCAAGVNAVSQKIQTDAEFNQVFLSDVRTARLLAEQTDDQLALKCWSYLEGFAVTNAPPVVETPEGEAQKGGVLSAYQKARNLRRGVVEMKISDEFRLECGPMLTDSMGALGRIGIRIAL